MVSASSTTNLMNQQHAAGNKRGAVLKFHDILLHKAAVSGKQSSKKGASYVHA